ncbi:hypothetical protein TNCV_4690721 [Trichonephila clavipes]|nr:hypothetical protein TNCV_4690721 [Trichonephila clavipes]
MGKRHVRSLEHEASFGTSGYFGARVVVTADKIKDTRNPRESASVVFSPVSPVQRHMWLAFAAVARFEETNFVIMIHGQVMRMIPELTFYFENSNKALGLNRFKMQQSLYAVDL